LQRGRGVQKANNSVDELKHAASRVGVDANGSETDPNEKLDNGE